MIYQKEMEKNYLTFDITLINLFKTFEQINELNFSLLTGSLFWNSRLFKKSHKLWSLE
jgi:hypothetical protein